MSLPGYDDWKIHNPDDDRCGHCGAGPSHKGWRPEECTGECGHTWRDPDAELEDQREREEERRRDPDYYRD